MSQVDGMRLGQRVGQLNPKFDRPPRMNRTPANHRRQRLAGDELEHQIQALAVFARLDKVACLGEIARSAPGLAQ